MAHARPTTEDLAPPPPRDAQDDHIDLDAEPMADTQLMTAMPPAADDEGSAAPHGEQPNDLPLLDDETADSFLDRWSEVQGRFVDDPQGAVRDGDSLVAEVMQELAGGFAQHKGALEEQWSRGGEPQTEELRVVLQQYRSFFQRLLAT